MAHDGGRNIILVFFRRIFLFWLCCFTATLADGTHHERHGWEHVTYFLRPLVQSDGLWQVVSSKERLRGLSSFGCTQEARRGQWMLLRDDSHQWTGLWVTLAKTGKWRFSR